MLLAADEYEGQVSEVGGFNNIYKLLTDEGMMVVRPDAAISNLAIVARSYSNGGPGQIVACFQGFRNISGSTVPLFRDRFIWPFVQFNRMVPASDLPRAIDYTCRRLAAFFDALCLPVRIVDMGPWKKYARRLYCAVAHMPDGSPTIAAMFFVAGDSYRRQCSIPENLDALDIGITEKVLSLIAMRHADEVAMRLPSALAPIQVVLTEQAAASLQKSARDFCFDGLRVAISPDSKKAFVGWRRRGVPLQIHLGRRGLRVNRRCQGWVDVSDGMTAGDVLRGEDELLWNAASVHELRVATPSYAATEPHRRWGREVEIVCMSDRMAERLGNAASKTFPLSWELTYIGGSMTFSAQQLNRCAVVTGAGRGIGRATTLALAQAGYDVVAAARTFPEIEAVAAETMRNSAPGRCLPIAVDVRDPSSVKLLFERAIGFAGRVDLLVTCAGIAALGGLSETLPNASEEMVATNFVGTFHCLYYARPHLVESQGSAIFVISRACRETYPSALGYRASKAGLVYLTRAAARDLAQHSVRILALSPGAVATRLRSGLFPEEDPSSLMQPNQVAEAVLATLGPGFACATGSIIDLPW